jgi:Bifunctional DNA primase/polymerase, N-terminal
MSGTNTNYNSTAQTGAQQHSVAERLFDEFGGSDLLDAGLKAIARGWKIFPCNGKKEPLTPRGFKDATTDPLIVTSRAKRWPGALWGRALPEDIVVIDLDMKRGKWPAPGLVDTRLS